MDFLEGWKKDFENFRQSVKGVSLPFSWGSPKADLPRIEEIINGKMANVIAPREFPDLGFWYYNKHDIDHIKRVIGYIYEILEARGIELEDHELYLLYVAAFRRVEILDNGRPYHRN